MIFVFDKKKNESNIEKHKVSFEEAQAIWEDPDLLVVPARKRGESRTRPSALPAMSMRRFTTYDPATVAFHA